ncbi:MAG: hypothetical protein RML94_00165 [Bacteroidia bacterium]|nr:hypothetical protein [Bacteroidia bacterium]
MARYNYYKKFQEGGMSGGGSAACMALQQALPQLPEDLKAGAQQALQTGKCEEFIKMLQEQAQQGSHNAQLEEGMPMAKFGAYFGMPIETIAYNMKIARLGLYSIAKAHKAQRGTKNPDVSNTLLQDLVDFVNREVLSPAPEPEPKKRQPSESELPPNVKRVIVDRKGEVWVMEDEEGREVYVRKKPAPLRYDEYLENNPITTKHGRKKTQKDTENWNKEIYLPWAKEEGLMDNYELEENPIEIAKRIKKKAMNPTEEEPAFEYTFPTIDIVEDAPKKTTITPSVVEKNNRQKDLLLDIIDEEIRTRYQIKDPKVRRTYSELIKDDMLTSNRTLIQSIEKFFNKP